MPLRTSERKIAAALLAVVLVWTARTTDAAAQDPGWAVDPAAFQFSMNVTSATYVDGMRGTNMNSVLAAFVGDEIRGVAKPVPVGDESVYFLTVYSNANGEPITFRMYDAGSDSVRESSQQIGFLSNAVLGEPRRPYRIEFGVDPAVNDPSTWQVSASDFSLTMTATVQVGIDGEELTDPDARMAAFVGSEVRGLASPTTIPGKRLNASTLFFLTIYANVDNESITLRVSSPARDTVYTFDHVFTFAADAVLGSPEAPLGVGSSVVTSRDGSLQIDDSLSLDIFPNPTAGDVEIRYRVPTGAPLDLKVFDVLGRLVADLDVPVGDASGRGRTRWRPLSAAGSRLVPGVYVMRLQGGRYSVSRTLVISR